MYVFEEVMNLPYLNINFNYCFVYKQYSSNECTSVICICTCFNFISLINVAQLYAFYF